MKQEVKLSLKLVQIQIKRLTAQELIMFDKFIGKEVCVKVPYSTGSAYIGRLSENGKDFLRLEDVKISDQIHQPSEVHLYYEKANPFADSVLINKSSGIEYIVSMEDIEETWKKDIEEQLKRQMQKS